MFHVLQVSMGYSDGSLERQAIEAAGGTLSLIASQDPDDIIAAGQQADGLLITLTNVTEKIIAAMPKLKLIVRAGIGVDNIDLAAAKERGIHVCNLPTYCQDEVADHTAALLLCLERKIYQQTQDLKAGKWNPAKIYKPIGGLQDAVIGLIGCGGIARKFFERIKPFGVRAIAYDPYLNPAIAQKAGIQLASLEQVLACADYVSLHMPLTEQTLHLINRHNISLMKDGAYLINTARGPLVDNDALCQALDSGKIAGAALDVVEGDLDGAKRFASYTNVLITPHSAYYSEKSNIKIRSQAGDVFAAYIRGETVPSMVI